LLVACAMPSTTVRTPDNRPSLVIAGAPPGSQLFIDGNAMGKAAAYDGQPQVLVVEPGRTCRRARHCGRLLFERPLRRKRDEDHPGALTMRSLARIGAVRFSPAQASAVCRRRCIHGGYDDALYRHTEPAGRDEFVAKLGMIDEAEQTGGWSSRLLC